MGGFFGVASKTDCLFDLFFGVDYHSHLGARRGGLAVYKDGKFDRSIHNIESSPFRTKFEKDVQEMSGTYGIGCISDYEPQPLIMKSHHGTYAITTVGKINNVDEIVNELFEKGHSHFLEMSGGDVNPTEVVASLINQKDNLIDGMRYALDKVQGSITFLVLNEHGIYVARDKYGRTPAFIAEKEDAYCVSFESYAYLNLGYHDYKELGPGEICLVTPFGAKTLVAPGNKRKICTFLWCYYGYPTSKYEGVSVETMRNECGRYLARRDNCIPDFVAGIPDSGMAHAIGYSNESKITFARPFIKYTPTWTRSFMSAFQSKRNLIARMKLIPVYDLIHDKKLLLIDDSIVRGTQMRETTEFLYQSGAKEVHVRSACPPILYTCKYLNFSRSSSPMDLITRKVIYRLEGQISDDIIKKYVDPDSENYAKMVEEIRKELNFTTLQYLRLDDLKKSVGIDPDSLCTYCWDGKNSD